MAEVDLTTKLKTFPKIKSVEVTEEKHVALKWSKVALAEKYDIKRSDNPSGGFTHIDWAKKFEFTDETTEKDITYWYKVIAWKRMEGKKTSTKASAVKPVVISDIPAVKNLKAETKDKKINLTWDKGEGDKFFVYRYSDHFSRPIFIGETKKPSFTDEHPVSGQAYKYMIQCIKKGEEKDLHGNFSKKVDGIFLDGTTILTANASFGKKISLSARLVAGCDGYILERSDSKDGAFKEVARTEDLTANSFEDKAPSRLKTYFYRICAYRKIGKEEFKGSYTEVKAVTSK